MQPFGRELAAAPCACAGHEVPWRMIIIGLSQMPCATGAAAYLMRGGVQAECMAQVGDNFAGPGLLDQGVLVARPCVRQRTE